MPLNPGQFHAQLQSALPRLALVAGDEPLLIVEAADAWRAQARAQGFEEREVLHVEAGFDWSQLARAGASLSLFASQRRIELHLGDKGPGKEGSEALVEFAANPPADVVLLIIGGAMDKNARKTKWFTTLEKAGAVLYAWPVKTAEHPRWVAQRLKQAGVQAEPDVIQWLALRTEGNLLACQQEINKLVLLTEGRKLDLATAEQLVADLAHYEAFDYVDRLIAGEAGPALRSLERLREEGEQPLAVLGSVSWALRGLEQIESTRQRQGNLDKVFRDARIWGDKQGQFRSAAQRLGLARIRHALGLALSVDRAAKGASPDSPWEELVKLTACMTGLALPVPVVED